jgi:hypothetical protein
MPVSEELQRIYASAPAGELILETLQLAHPLFSQTWFITNAAQPFAATLETGSTVDFICLPFAARQPVSDGSGNQDLGLVIDNVDREIIEELERAIADPSQRIAVTYRVFASGDLGAPGSEPISLSISEISAGLTTVEATAGRADVLNRKFPAVLYEIGQFPGLDR